MQKKIIVTTIMFLLYGCSNRLNLNANNLNYNKYSNLAYTQTWNLKSKIEISNFKNHQNVPLVLYMHWQKLPEHSIVNFNTLFNIKNLTIKVENNLNKIKFLENNIETEHLNILNKVLSSNLNFNNLNYWLIGIPNPNTSYEINSNGFIQNDCLITYKEFKKVYYNKKNFLIPKKIILKHINKSLVHQIHIVIFNQNIDFPFCGKFKS